MTGRPFGRGNHRSAKLTGEQVLEIRWRYVNERGVTQSKLCREYGVSISTIANIVNGNTWQGIAGWELLGKDKPSAARPPTSEALEASAQRMHGMLDEGGLYSTPVPYSEPELNPSAQAKLSEALDAIKHPREDEASKALDRLLNSQGDQK